MKYKKKFYADRDKRTRHSAQRIISILLEHVPAASVVDVGCGVGTWLSVFRELGVEEVLGVEGPWVTSEMLVIGSNEFKNADLTRPLEINRRFDVAMSLEVAEHLPADVANQFVETLTSLSDIVLFSAAVPLQGGKNHVNEQPLSYWKKLFEEKNYVWVDAIRPNIWDDEKISFWYAQNSCLFVNKRVLDQYPSLNTIAQQDSRMVDVIHPRLFYWRMHNYSLSKWFRSKIGRL